MTISRLEVATFPVPFRTSFAHASAERTAAENVIVLASSSDGVTGYGEGCPRDYVTGETTAGARKFLKAHGPDIAQSVRSVADLRQWISGHQKEIDGNPAAFCAVELSLLDHMARSQDKSIEALLDQPPLDVTAHRYTAVVGSGGTLKARLIIMRYLASGLRNFKVKLSDDPSKDARRFGWLRLLPASGIRFDANNQWRDVSDCVRHLEGMGIPGFAIEEPLAPGNYQGLREVAKKTGLAIILDESFLTPKGIENLASDVRWIANVRISKLGGLLRTLDAVAMLRDKGIGIVVGAHVGETGILTRAALPVARAAGDQLVGQEGAFGTYLLQQDLTTPSPRFGFRGLVPQQKLAPAGSPGFGLSIDIDALQERETLL